MAATQMDPAGRNLALSDRARQDLSLLWGDLRATTRLRLGGEPGLPDCASQGPQYPATDGPGHHHRRERPRSRVLARGTSGSTMAIPRAASARFARVPGLVRSARLHYLRTNPYAPRSGVRELARWLLAIPAPAQVSTRSSSTRRRRGSCPRRWRRGCRPARRGQDGNACRRQVSRVVSSEPPPRRTPSP